MAETESCYIFDPTQSYANSYSYKKRKLHHDPGLFPPLLQERLDGDASKARAGAYAKSWPPLETVLKDHIENVNRSTVRDVAKFLRRAKFPSTSLHTAFLIACPGTGVPAGLLSLVVEALPSEKTAILIDLQAQHSANLKTICKVINQQALVQHNDRVIDRSYYLNYDLQILYEHVERNDIKRVIISMPETEAFHGGLISDLLELLSAWQDRIPFCLVFGTSTSLQLFEERISKSAIDRIVGTSFDIHSIDLEKLFSISQSINITSEQEATQQSNKSVDATRLWLGSAISSTILRNQTELLHPSSSFVNALKYIYMTHFFANGLSAYLDPMNQIEVLPPEHAEAARHLPSFKSQCEVLLSHGKAPLARELLSNDKTLSRYLFAGVKQGIEAVNKIMTLIDLMEITSKTIFKTPVAWSELYIQAMAGKLIDSTDLVTFMANFKLMNSNSAITFLHHLRELQNTSLTNKGSFDIDVDQFSIDLTNLDTAREASDSVPMVQSGHKLNQGRMQTTIIGAEKRVGLTAQAAILSSVEERYTSILDNLHDHLYTYIKASLVNPKQLFASEIFIFDSTSPYRDVFEPRPRFAIERALFSPHDYLGHEFQADDEDSLENSQPAISTIYKLLSECGTLVNAADLWSAFWTMVRPTPIEEGDEDNSDAEGTGVMDIMDAKALFARSLVEMRYLGLVKNSRKKEDHLARLTWRGL